MNMIDRKRQRERQTARLIDRQREREIIDR